MALLKSYDTNIGAKASIRRIVTVRRNKDIIPLTKTVRGLL